jgi:hypothetical protein
MVSKEKSNTNFISLLNGQLDNQSKLKALPSMLFILFHIDSYN